MLWEVRQGCPANDFFATSFDPIFRWLSDAVIPRNRSFPDCLQQPACAYADDSAVSAQLFTIAPARHTIDLITVMTSTTKSVIGSPCGNHTCEALSKWIGANCLEFREMKIAKFAKYVGTMSAPKGLQRWTGPRNKFIRVCGIVGSSPESLVDSLVAPLCGVPCDDCP